MRAGSDFVVVDVTLESDITVQSGVLEHIRRRWMTIFESAKENLKKISSVGRKTSGLFIDLEAMLGELGQREAKYNNAEIRDV
jgi:hypothetical protein